MTDHETPSMMFQTTSVSILSRVATGEIDANDMARLELMSRGLNEHGEWIGFKEAMDLFSETHERYTASVK